MPTNLKFELYLIEKGFKPNHNKGLSSMDECFKTYDKPGCESITFCLASITGPALPSILDRLWIPIDKGWRDLNPNEINRLLHDEDEFDYLYMLTQR